MFGRKMNTTKKYKLSEALSIANICYDEGAHDALVDARNTAKLFAKIQLDEEFELSPYFIRENAEDICSLNPFSHRYQKQSCYTY